MSTTYLPFTLGDNTGKLMIQIAYEHLLDGNIDKCLNVFKGLIGPDNNSISFDTFKPILLGKQVLVVKDNDLYIEEKSEKYSDYPNINMREIFIKKSRILDKSISDYRKLIGYLSYNKSYSVTISVPVNDIYRFAFTGDSKSLSQQFLDNIEYERNDLNILISIVKELKNFFENTLPKLSNLLIWIYQNFKEDILDKNQYNRYINEMKEDLSNIFDKESMFILRMKYKNLIDYISTNENIISDIEDNYDDFDEDEIEEMYNFLNEVRNIKYNYRFNELSSTNSYNNLDAAWISPFGDIYGLKGPVYALLHLQIADALYDLGLIPLDYKNNPESYLEENGWIKIHDNDVLFMGYYHREILTSSQFRTLLKISDERNGLYLGYRKKYFTTEELRKLDDNQLKSIFNF